MLRRAVYFRLWITALTAGCGYTPIDAEQPLLAHVPSDPQLGVPLHSSELPARFVQLAGAYDTVEHCFADQSRERFKQCTNVLDLCRNNDAWFLETDVWEMAIYRRTGSSFLIIPQSPHRVFTGILAEDGTFTIADSAGYSFQNYVLSAEDRQELERNCARQ